MKKTSVFVLFVLLACNSDPVSNPNVPAGSEGQDGVTKMRCVENGGFLVSKRGGGWWCKINGDLHALEEFA